MLEIRANGARMPGASAIRPAERPYIVPGKLPPSISPFWPRAIAGYSTSRRIVVIGRNSRRARPAKGMNPYFR